MIICSVANFFQMVVDDHTLILCSNGGLAVGVSSPPFIPRPITSTFGFPGLLEDADYKYETTRILSAENVKGMALTKQSILEESFSPRYRIKARPTRLQRL